MKLRADGGFFQTFSVMILKRIISQSTTYHAAHVESKEFLKRCCNMKISFERSVIISDNRGLTSWDETPTVPIWKIEVKWLDEWSSEIIAIKLVSLTHSNV